jgi:hypothetical protein
MGMNILKSLTVLGVAILSAPAAHATTITVQNLGSILNDSVSFPNTKTPGSGKTFEEYFEFTLPTAEYITASMSISGPLMDQVVFGTGHLSLYTWTSTSGFAPFIPMGTLIEQATLSAPSLGGQTAVVGSFTGGVRANSRAVRAVLASAMNNPFRYFKQLARGHPSDCDDVRQISTVASKRRGSLGRARDRHQPRDRPVLVEPVWPDVRCRDS